MRNVNSNQFIKTLTEHGLSVSPNSIETLWLNITDLCNQRCIHCHVDASPNKTNEMSQKTMDRCLAILAENEGCKNLDITGGAPELNPGFRYLVENAKKIGKNIIVRHNLTVTLDGNPKTGEDMTYLPAYFAEKRVILLVSLPHYEKDITDNIRGCNTFEKSIRSLLLLNELGYGRGGDDLILNLVYNHNGPLTVADRMALEDTFREQLRSQYGISFNAFLAVTNMPINRFRQRLDREHKYADYMNRLMAAFNQPATDGLVCRSLVSVGHDGKLYDCDFNRALGLQILDPEPMTVYNFDIDSLLHRKIRFGQHCFGCTAGGGSS